MLFVVRQARGVRVYLWVDVCGCSTRRSAPIGDIGKIVAGNMRRAWAVTQRILGMEVV